MTVTNYRAIKEARDCVALAQRGVDDPLRALRLRQMEAAILTKYGELVKCLWPDYTYVLPVRQRR